MKYFLAWAALVVVTVLAYWPGLQGPFLFDDFGSLAAMGQLGGIKDWYTFKSFVFGGFSGPTGRPLSLLTFLIDGNNWPTDAWPFKRTNVVIHLLVGGLLAAVTDRVLCLTGVDRKKARWLALLSAACWLLHPFLVSTTLYVVQRMAQLSTLFIFAGMLTYLHGRTLLGTKPVKAYLTMSIGLGLCTFLAMIAKENGILLPLLVGVLEITLLSDRNPRVAALDRRWAALFLLLPSVVIVLYLVNQALRSNFFVPNPPRDFSTYERLLTELRILVDYLQHWFLPQASTPGVFQDHFVASKGFFVPLTTAISAVFHVSLISIGIVKRHKWPLFSFAVLFFYASHLLESTSLNLELYFEHRNYLATAFLLLPLLVMLQKKTSRSLFLVIALSMLFVLAGLTRLTTTVWASYPSIVESAARKAPNSARAQQQFSLLLYNAGRYQESLQVANEAIARIPDDEQLLIWRGTVRCNLGMLTANNFQELREQLAPHEYDLRGLALYEALLDSVVSRKCPAVSLDDLHDLFADMLQVPRNANPRSASFSQITYLMGSVDIHRGKPDSAMSNFRRSLQARPGASRAMLMASLMASKQFYAEAMELSAMALARLERTEEGMLGSAQVSERDIREFRKKVQEEIEQIEVDSIQPGAPDA